MDSPSTASLTYCEKHPDRETGLRCNRCNRLMCTQCAVQTPTGYRCVDCIKEQNKAFDTTEVQDYVVAAAVAVVLSWIGAALVTRFGFFTILLAPAAGTLIAEAVRTAVRKRRSKKLYQVVAIAIVVGSLPVLIQSLFLLLSGYFFSVVWAAVYTFMATSSAYYRMSGIRIRR